MTSTTLRMIVAGAMALAGIGLVVYGTVTHDGSVAGEGAVLMAGSGLTAWAESNVATPSEGTPSTTTPVPPSA